MGSSERRHPGVLSLAQVVRPARKLIPHILTYGMKSNSEFVYAVNSRSHEWNRLSRGRCDFSRKRENLARKIKDKLLINSKALI